jgi:hypothetical protein
MHSDRCGHTSGWECHANESGKVTKIQVFKYRDKMNVEPELNGHASNNQSQRYSNERFKEKSGSQPVTHSTDSP